MRLRLVFHVVGLLDSYIAMDIHHISELVDHHIINYIKKPYQQSPPPNEKTGHVKRKNKTRAPSQQKAETADSSPTSHAPHVPQPHCDSLFLPTPGTRRQ